MKYTKVFLYLFYCSLLNLARGQFNLFGIPSRLSTPTKSSQPLVVLPDHLKDDTDDFDEMKKTISQGMGLQVNEGSYDEAASLRQSIQMAQMNNPNSVNLQALGGSKVKKPSNRVGASLDDPILQNSAPLIVLPDHLKEQDSPNQLHQEHEIDPNSFHEAASIRSEIKHAQMGDHAEINNMGGSQSHNTYHRLGSSKSDSEDSLLNLNIFTDKERYGGTGELLKHEQLFNKTDNLWHANVYYKGSNLRDHLTLTKVDVNVNFMIGEGADIEIWRAFRKFSDKNSLTLVAMTNNGLLLVKEYEGEFKVLQTIEMKEQTFNLDVFEKWSDETSSWIGIVIVSTPAQIIWYESNGDHTDLEEVWRWNVHKTMIEIKYFRQQDTDLLILVNDQVPSSADVYEFDYFKKLFWIAQVIHLEVPTKSIAILRAAGDFLVCFPQTDQVLVYQYQTTMFDHGRLVLKEIIDAPQVTMVSGFHIGGYTYLAIGGPSSQILKFTDGMFEQQLIKGDELRNVVYWRPIHVHTFRDDLLLLALREIDLKTHKALDIKGVIWDLESFRVTPNIPCYDDEDDLTKGLTCILDPRRKEGLWGSSFVQHHGHLTLVIPQNEAPSALYDLFYQIVPAPDPIIEELQRIEETYEILADIVEYQDTVFENALETIANAISIENDNYITGAWEIQHLGAKEVIQSDSVKTDEMLLGGQIWTSYDHKLDLPTLEEYLAKSESELEYIQSEVSHSRPLRYSDSPFNAINTLTNGKFNIDTLNVLYPTYSTHQPPISPTENNHYRKKRHLKVAGPVEFETLEVQELQIESINGIPVDEIIFSDDALIELKGPVTFENILSVDEVILNNQGKVNNIDLSEQLIHFSGPKKLESSLKFESVETFEGIDAQNINPKELSDSKFKSDSDPNVLHVKTLEVFGNVNVKKVNGRDWDELVTKITPKNLPIKMDELTVDGTVYVDHTNLDVINLNDFNFIKDFVFGSSQDNYVQISGKKIALQIDSGSLDGIHTPDVITLKDFQKISGKTVFRSLEVSDDLEVNGNIRGEKLDEFQENLTLLESRVVDASTIFHNLIVEGPIKIRDTLNNIAIDETLGNVIYTDGNKIEINAYKSFDHANFEEGIDIKSGLLNGLPIKDIVTKSTEQTLHFTELDGDVYFERLELDGLFDFINITELDMNSVKLFGDQYSEVSMSSRYPVNVKSLKIENDINGDTLETFQRIDKEFNLKGEVVFDELFLDYGRVHGGIHTNGYLNGIDLKEFEATRFSLTKPQHISAPCYIQDVTIHGNLKNDIINNVPTDSFTNSVLKSQSVRNLLYSGEILIDNLYVDKNVAIKSLNGIDLNHVLENVVWLNRPNTIQGDLTFTGPVIIYGNLSYGNLLNDFYFERFLNDLVLRNQEVLYLKGIKGFPNGFHVLENIDTEYINDYNVQHILRKDGSVACDGHITVHGNVHVRYLDSMGTINNVSTQLLNNLYDYEKETDTHVLKSDVIFNDNVQIDQLIVNGPFNGMPNLTSYLHSIIRDDQDLNIAGSKTFMNLVFFDQGVDFHLFNDIHLTEYVKDIVLLNPNEKTMINSLVSFHDPVSAPSAHIANDIATHNIADCSPQEWIYNGLLTNQHEKILTSLNFKSEHISSPSFLTVNLNGKPMEHIVTLHTAQHFASPMEINELYLTGEINVAGTVNGVKLPLAKENTLMTYGIPQHIATYSSAFPSLRVIQSLTLENLNGVPVSNIATLHDDLYFESPLEFATVSASSLKTQDLISGYDFNYWYDNSIRTGNAMPQKVYKNWTVENLYLESDLKGNGVINYVKVDEIVQSIDNSKKSIDEAIVGVAREYQDVCHGIQKMSENVENGVNFFKYFEQSFELSPTSSGKLEYSKVFKSSHETYVLMNMDCMSEIYQWDTQLQKFNSIQEPFNSGHVSEMLVLGNDTVLLLSRDDSSKCDVKGLSLNKLDSSKFIQVKTSNDNIESIHSNPNKKTFYGLIGNSKVVEYDLNLNQVEEWLLPDTTTIYRFLPFDLGIGLSLSDGRNIVALTSMIPNNRFKREFPDKFNLHDLDTDLREAQYGYGNSEDAVGETNLYTHEWRKYETTQPDIIFHTMDPLKHTTTFMDENEYKNYDYDNFEPNQKLSDTLRHQAAGDLQKTSTFSPDYYNPDISPSFNYLHKEPESIQANIETQKSSQQLPELQNKKESEFESGIRGAFANIKSKLDMLKDKIVTPQINNLTELPNVDLGALAGIDTSNNNILRFGRTPNPLDEVDNFDPTMQIPDEINFGGNLRMELTKWSKATQDLKDLLVVKINENKNNELSDPILEQEFELETSATKNEISKLQSQFETQFSSQLHELVSKWNKKQAELKTVLEEKPEPDASDPILTQEQDLKEVMLSHPALQNTNEKEFSDQLRGLVSKWYKKVVELGEKLSENHDNKGHDENVSQVKELENLLQSELSAFQPKDDKDYAQELRSLISEWNKKATALEQAIKTTKNTEEFESILTETHQLKELIETVPTLQTTAEREFVDQLRKSIIKWNEVTNELKNRLEALNKSEAIVGSNISTSQTPLDQSTENPRLTDDLKELISKWTQFSQQFTEKAKTPSTTEGPLIETTHQITDPITQAPKLTVTEATVFHSTIFPTISSPEDVQMIPDLKKTDFVEKFDHSTTMDPQNRFVPYETTQAPLFELDQLDVKSTTEPIVGQAIPVGGVKTMENFHVPAKHKGEIVFLNVGIHGMQRKLTAISSVVNKKSTIPGQHDVIQIYEDIYEGKLFQTIPCYRPSELSVIHLMDETLLTFLEGNSGVRVYAYRGIQGFVAVSNFNLPRTSHKMEHVTLNVEKDSIHECSKEYLCVTTGSDLIFYEAETEPEKKCHLKASLNFTFNLKEVK
uniref:CSON002090 protein n=1 Tax=Culicoides sonorensis TaxID=179676 RepID=A0A336KZZ1_CULSO